MAEVSQALRAARERAGLSLEEVSARTKIKPAFLQAIERGQFEVLPGEFFTRAFLRTYAREVRLSPDAVVQEYDAGRTPSRPAPVEIPEASVETLPAPAAGSRDALREAAGPHADNPPRRLWPFALVAAAIIAVLWVAMRPAPDMTNEPDAVGTAGEVAAAEMPPAPVATDPEPETLTLEIRPSGNTWVAATADGERAVYRLLGPGDRIIVTARQELAIRLGNAGAFEYSINGRPGRALGAEGEVREVRITPDTYRTFLR